MKFKTTAILLAVFAVLLVFVLFLDKKPKEGAAGPEEKLIAAAVADVTKMTLKRGTETLAFSKDDKGAWMLTEPMNVKADDSAADNLATQFADLRIERVVEKEKADLAAYEIPKTEVALWFKGKADPVRVLIGAEQSIDHTFYAQKEGDPRVVLLPDTIKSSIEKTLFDYRQKDIFRFESKDVAAINLQAKDIRWSLRKKDDEWMFADPPQPLARATKVSTFLDTLSGIRAKEFISEDKKAEELKANGLDKPETTVTLSLPAANKEIVFAFHRGADKTLITTSDSTKVIAPETDPLMEVEKRVDDLRESKAAVFNAWQASKVSLKRGALALTVTKAANDKWYFDAAQKEETDLTKVDTFIRKIESLEASSYVDAPKSSAEYGLDKPEAEITIWTKDTMSEKPLEKSVTVLTGKVDKELKQVFIKNPRLPYLFKVDSAFLDEFPKEKKDWKPLEPEKKDEKK